MPRTKHIIVGQALLSTGLLIALSVHMFRTPDVVRAHRFELVDGDGEVIATLGKEGKATKLRLFVAEDGGLVELSAGVDGADIKASYEEQAAWFEVSWFTRMILKQEGGGLRSVGPGYHSELPLPDAPPAPEPSPFKKP